MLNVKTDFQDRVNEVNIYFTFIEKFIPNSDNDDLNKILKSNLLLMLYNLIESSISNAIEEIHNDIHRNSISYDLLKVELREVLVRHLKNHINPKDFVLAINNIALDIVKKSFNKGRISNGNIDSKKIRELGASYGFSYITNYSQTKNGACLLTIKRRRNDLAHGTFSFTEVGKDYTNEDLEIIKNEAINYLREILDNIERYLIRQDYKIAI